MKSLGKIRERLHAYGRLRQEVISASNTALHMVKKAIFSAHRGNVSEAESIISDVEQSLHQIEKKYHTPSGLLDEGAFRAALEEYVEATLFVQFVQGKSMGNVGKVTIPDEVYIAGLCDVPGELYRFALRKATLKEDEEVLRAADVARQIIEELASFDLTSYLRTKSDQAKQAFHRLEEVVYDISFRS